MKTHDVKGVVRTLKPMIGHPVWGIRQVTGSFLYLEFGTPHLWIREPRLPSPKASMIAAKVARQRLIYPEGEWHLMLHMCAWRIVLDTVELANSESTPETIALVADGDISGRIIEGITIDIGDPKTVFTFENGLTVETSKPAAYEKAEADNHEQWHVTEENGDVMSFRGDGAFCFMKGNTRPAEQIWWRCEGAPYIELRKRDTP